MKKIEKMLQKYRAERDKLDFLIQALEKEFPGSYGEKHALGGRPGRKKSATSVHALSEKALEIEQNRNGLKVRSLITEIAKLRFMTKSDKPENTVNSILRRYPKTFRKLADGRWILVKYAPRSETSKLGSNGHESHPKAAAYQ